MAFGQNRRKISITCVQSCRHFELRHAIILMHCIYNKRSHLLWLLRTDFPQTLVELFSGWLGPVSRQCLLVKSTKVERLRDQLRRMSKGSSQFPWGSSAHAQCPVLGIIYRNSPISLHFPIFGF